MSSQLALDGTQPFSPRVVRTRVCDSFTPSSQSTQAVIAPLWPPRNLAQRVRTMCYAAPEATSALATPMNTPNTDDARDMVATIYRDESRRVFATLVRLLGDFDR